MCQKAPEARRRLGQVLPSSLRRNQPCCSPDIALPAPERGNKGRLSVVLVGAAVLRQPLSHLGPHLGFKRDGSPQRNCPGVQLEFPGLRRFTLGARK